MKQFPNQGSVYWFDPEPVKGSEIREVRPCVVVSPDEMNQNLQTVIIAPLTTTIQPWPFRLTVKLLNQQSSIACDQIRVIDKSRLRAVIGELKLSDREKLLNLLQLLFQPS